MIDRLTPRQRAVLALVCDGHTNREIATRLGISHRTVEIHRSTVLKVLRARSSAHAVAIFLRAQQPPEVRP